MAKSDPEIVKPPGAAKISLPVAERWFDIEDLDQGVSLISEPHIDPFFAGNIWFVRGRERNLLVDTGTGLRSLREAFGARFDKPLLAVVTHAYYDHMGGLHEFPERASHPAEAHILAGPTAHNTVMEHYVSADMFEALPYGGFELSDYKIEPAPPTRLLEEGDVIDLGDRRFEVLHLPGYTPGSIGLWENGTGILFSGDTIADYADGLIDDTYRSNAEDFSCTMRRLREVPVRIVHAGHFPSFGRERMVEIIDGYFAAKRH